MFSNLSTSITDSDYRKWVKQSNEELIPKPLAFCFYFPDPDSNWDYLADLRRELEIKSRLFDRDREVIQVSWDSDGEEPVAEEHRQHLIESMESLFRVSSNVNETPLPSAVTRMHEYDLVGFGVAAISRIGPNFCQHTGDLNNYRRFLALNQLPVVRGLLGSAKDKENA